MDADACPNTQDGNTGVVLAQSAEWAERVRAWESATPKQQQLCERIRALKQTVTNDLENIRLVFPEFTPHDIHLHANRLLRIADAILVPNMSKLNVVEYLVFAAAVYAHDWGMSVSDEGKKAIRFVSCSRKQPGNPATADTSIHLLPDEQGRFEEYLRSLPGAVEPGNPRELTAPEWAGYLRSTHGRRSGARIRAFFAETHHRFGEYVALVAEGHAVTQEEIAETETYLRQAAPVLDDSNTVNLQALAIYLRLIDLFDISDERTPFSLWRFINPRDREARIEWSKHMALAPVHLGTNGSLIFQGEVRDPDVWARVCDLRRYSEEQFDFSRSLLNRYPDDRYSLPFHWLDWQNVTPRGLPAEVVRFEFDRNTIFSLLGEEVYDRDPYVFIRELLQNAIDAMATRERVLEKKQAALSPFASIRIECDSRPEGDYTFVIRDAGTGMDAFIVRNYLAVAGKSFYRSSDFRKLGIDYDAISRFGIGILSCFMVADSIDIDTHPDPTLFPGCKPLQIHIDNVDAHWSMTYGDANDVIGTTVTVRVSARKVSDLQKERPESILQEWKLTRSQLGVTHYLKKIAGFVQYQILIDENGAKTAILHPDFDETSLPDGVRSAYKVHKLGLEMSIARAVPPPSVNAATRLFRVETLCAKQDLGINDVDGAISFLVPKDTAFQLSNRTGPELDETYGINFYHYSRQSRNGRFMSLAESAARDRFVACFCNGIFVPGVDYPSRLLDHEDKKEQPVEKCGTSALSGVQVFLNLKRSHLNAARSRLIGNEKWADKALEAVGRHFISKWKVELLAATPLQRLRLLFHYGQFYPVSLSCIADAIGLENWPVCLLGAEGKLTVVPWRTVESDMIGTVPGVLKNACGADVDRLLRGKDDVTSKCLEKWDGLPMIVGPWSLWVGCVHYETITHMPLRKLGYEKEVRWVTPPFQFLPPVQQEVWTPGSIKTKTSECPTGKATRGEMTKLARGWCEFEHNDDGRYPSAFENYCFWGPRLINARHELGSLLLKVILLTEPDSKLSWDFEIGAEIMRRFSALLGPRTGLRGNDGINFHFMNEELQALAVLVKPHASELAIQLAQYKLDRKDFLPGVFWVREDRRLVHLEYNNPAGSMEGVHLPALLQQEHGIQPWGQILEKNTPWPSWTDLDTVFSKRDQATPAHN